MKSCPKTFLSTLSFCEKDAVVGISVIFVRARKRRVGAAGTQHLSLSAFAPFNGALLCNRTARTLLHPLPTEQGLLVKRLPHRSPIMLSVPTTLTSPAFVFRRAELFCWINALSVHLCHSIWDVGWGRGDSGPGRNGCRPGEPIPVWPG